MQLKTNHTWLLSSHIVLVCDDLAIAVYILVTLLKLLLSFLSPKLYYLHSISTCHSLGCQLNFCTYVSNGKVFLGQTVR